MNVSYKWLAVYLLVFAGCADAPVQQAVNAKHAEPFQGLWQHPGESRLYAWVSSSWTFSTTSYAIEGDDGLVLIDTQFLPTETAAFVDAVEAATHKKARVAVVLHANPDKFNGTAALQARGVRVVTSRQVSEFIPAVHEKRVRAFADRYAPHYPRELPTPDVFGDADTVLSVAGIDLQLHVVGAGCSAAHVVATWNGPHGRHLFAGDLIANGSHSWLEIGKADAWLQRLDEMDALHPDHVHPGRGMSGGAPLVAQERSYLLDVIDAVARRHPALPVDDDDVEAVRQEVLAKHPSLRFPVFLNLGIRPEIERQAALAPR